MYISVLYKLPGKGDCGSPTQLEGMPSTRNNHDSWNRRPVSETLKKHNQGQVAYGAESKVPLPPVEAVAWGPFC
jgi:hypothetical protein